MTENTPNQMTGRIAIAILPQTNGQYVCQMSMSLGGCDREVIQCSGQTQEHAIAIALEQLAETYRQTAEAQQNIDWDVVERSELGEPIEKQYHVLLHYEDVITAESKFEAMHNTIMGNTVVENAKIAVIAIDPELQIEPLTRSWE